MQVLSSIILRSSYLLLNAGVNQLAIKADGDTPDDKFILSDTERTSYEKTFSSILVPFASLAVGEDIGQGMFVNTVSYMWTIFILITISEFFN